MAKTINIKELAKYCNVSPSTISRVYSGNATVCDATREKILIAARELNYAPQQTSRKNNVAIIIPSSQAIQPPSWFASMLVTKLLREIYHAGFAPRLYDSNDIQLIQPNFNIAAISLNWRPNQAQFDYLASLQRPLIDLNTVMPFAHSVCSNHRHGIDLAMEYLLTRGHKKIGFLSQLSGNWGDTERLNAYKDNLAKAGIEFDSRLAGGANAEGGLAINALDQMFRCGVTALLCPHEDWTMQLQYLLQLLKKRVPDDVSVISGEVTGLSRWMLPPHTTIRQDLDTLTKYVIDILNDIDSMEKSEFKRLEVPYELIERDSVNVL